MTFLSRQLRRLRFAFGGIFYGLRYDFSFRWQVFAAGIFLVAVGYIAWPLTSTEILLALDHEK